MSTQEMRAVFSNIDAERAVLGSILIDPDAFEQVHFLRERDFFHGKYRTIFRVMRELNEQHIPIDFEILVDRLTNLKGEDASWARVEIFDLLSSTPTAMYVDHYAKIVKRDAGKRHFVQLAEKMARSVFEPEADAQDLVTRAMRALENIASDQEEEKSTDIGSVIKRQIDRISDAIDARESGQPLGLFTGWALDRVMGGFQEGNVVTIAARPGAGKSSFAIALLLRLAQRGFAGAYLSLEMSESEIADKLISNLTGIDSLKFRNGQLNEEDMQEWFRLAPVLSELPISILDSECTTLTDIKRKLRILQREGLRFAIIDYVQLMSAGFSEDTSRGENRVQVISAISRGIKQMAKELGIVVFMVSQLNRAVEMRSDKRPMLSDLRESGSIEQDSDSVIMLYRDDYYNEQSEEPNIAEIIVAKNRHGDTGIRKMYFKREICSFNDVEMTRIALGS